jgi:CIC family chloride channel protein
LATGSGLAPDRKGPTVQMGASVARLVGQIFKPTWPDCRVLMAAGAGVGLANAFNAPIAGALFVLEDSSAALHHGSRLWRSAILDRPCSSTDISGSRAGLSRAGAAFPSKRSRLLFFLFGVFIGTAAIADNHPTLGAMAADRLHRWPVELRAAIISPAVGMLGWIALELIGGDSLTPHALTSAECWR